MYSANVNLYTNSYTSLDFCLEELNTFDYDPSKETVVLGRIADAFIKVFNNFRTITLHPFSKFRRSELMAELQSKSTQIKALYNKNILDGKVLVPVPNGMINDYPITINEVINLYNTINLERTMAKLIDYIYRFSKTQDHSFLFLTKQLTKDITNVDKRTDDHIKKIFAKKSSIDMRPFNEVFGTAKDFRKCKDDILTFNEYFQYAANLTDKVDFIEKGFIAIMDKLEKVKNKTDLIALHDLVYTAAMQLDYYGIALHMMQIIEHNYVLALREVLKKN